MSSTAAIQPQRLKSLNDRRPRDGRCVVYWMQQSQRAACNHALEYAVQQANHHRRPLLVVLGLMDDYPEANLRHYRFMLEGLRETRAALERRGIRLVVKRGHPVDVATDAARDAVLLVCDRGYLRHQRQWRAAVADAVACPVVQVESDAVVPVEAVSDKAEWAARTIRPKIHRLLERYLVDLRTTPVDKDSLGLRDDGVDLEDLDGTLAALRLDTGVAAVEHLFRGGTGAAGRLLREFVARRLDRYDENRNRPETDDVSHMSMYLHFGQISPLYVALRVGGGADRARESYLEELLVRRALAQNFVLFTEAYDRFEALPRWARRTLHEHARDRRRFAYTREQLEQAQTHDPYWNAAMKEMRHTGYAHNYMRMYWGKKILEWTPSPESAFRTALELNDKYFLDGRDASSYANVGWIFGLHDRPWAEREIFGTVRYLSASGLERKCDIDAYIAKVEALCSRQGAPLSCGGPEASAPGL